MKIIQCKQGGETKTEKVTIGFKSQDAIKYGDIVGLYHEGVNRYFKINKLCISKNVIYAEATQCGYYKMLNKSDINLQELIGLEVVVITDKDTISTLQKESGYC